MSVSRSKIVILVFGMESCPACHDYLPRLRSQVEQMQRAGYPFVIYEPHMTTADGDIPIVMVDATSEDPSVVAVADQHQVHALPTTILLPRRGHPAKFEGALNDVQIHEVLVTAIGANR